MASPSGRQEATRAWVAQNLLALTAPAPLIVQRHARYLVGHRRLAHLRHPETFSEKVNWRIVHDRRPLLGETCDKLRAKDKAAQLGIAVPETYWAGVDVAELSGVHLPARWVLKPNHGCGQVYFGFGQVTRPADVAHATRDWLGPSFAERCGEWAYSTARRLLIAEQRLGDGEEAPIDYKLFMFDGEPALISVEVDRITNWRRRVYTPDWTALTVRLGLGGRIRPLAPVAPKPATLEAMLAAGRELSRGFDFLRVDLYSEAGTVYLGELTPYPAGGLARYWPRAFDLQLGAQWHLPQL